MADSPYGIDVKNCDQWKCGVASNFEKPIATVAGEQKKLMNEWMNEFIYLIRDNAEKIINLRKKRWHVPGYSKKMLVSACSPWTGWWYTYKNLKLYTEL